MKVAVVAWNALPVVEPSAGTAIGGLETFAWLLARELARRPDVSTTLVMRHPSAPREETVAGVELKVLVEPSIRDREVLAAALRTRASFPWFSRDVFRLTWLMALFRLGTARIQRLVGGEVDRLSPFIRSIEADVWIVLGTSAESCQVVELIRTSGLPAYVWVQSNAEVDPAMLDHPHQLNTCGVLSSQVVAALREASGVLCQTHWQQSRLEKFGLRECHHIPNPFDPAFGVSADTTRPPGNCVLWIGRADRLHKRPHLALQAARLLPDIPFTLVLNGGDAQIEAEIRRDCPANVTLVRTIPRAEMRAAFLSSRLFLSTGSSLLEGFPNVLLEAAGTGTPIVSCEDFDQFLATSGAGLVKGDSPAAIAAAIQILWHNATSWEQFSLRGRRHTAQHHGIEPIVASVLKLCPPVP